MVFDFILIFTELMKKSRFDHLSTIADTKTALKYVFQVAADNRKVTLELQSQIEELKVRYAWCYCQIKCIQLLL